MPNQEELRTKMLQGKYKILLFRKYGDEQEDATKLVFQTEHSFDYSRDLERIVTKDGTVVKVGDLETGVDIDAIQSVKDPAYEMLQEAAIKGEKLELWEVNIDPDLEEDGKFPAVYCQGYLESWNPTNPAEDEAEISSTFVVEHEPQFGMATVTEEQQQTAQYAFRDTIAESNDGGVEG